MNPLYLLIYLLFFICVEVFAYALYMSVDCFCKYKKYRTKKTKLPLFKAKVAPDISYASYWLQIINFVYVLIFWTFALLDVFVCEHLFFRRFNFISAEICCAIFGISAILFVFAGETIKDNEKQK